MSQPPDNLPSKNASGDGLSPEGLARAERRARADRRGSDRQGKYDRRRNRCVHCLHFKVGEDRSGHCAMHQVVVDADMFACPVFEPLPGP